MLRSRQYNVQCGTDFVAGKRRSVVYLKVLQHILLLYDEETCMFKIYVKQFFFRFLYSKNQTSRGPLQ